METKIISHIAKKGITIPVFSISLLKAEKGEIVYNCCKSMGEEIKDVHAIETQLLTILRIYRHKDPPRKLGYLIIMVKP